jgi:hypothetical protein
MVKKLYLDGCSLTSGQGLPPEQALRSLFKNVGDYNVLDNSRPGKSNIAIAFDTYKNFKDYDLFVLGFTYSGRFGLKYKDQNLDFFPGFHGKASNLEPHSLDVAHTEIYKYFYTVFESPYCNDLSDMIVDTLISFLISQNKEVIAFSWESRQVQAQIEYPYIGPTLRLSDGHLNANGTLELYNFLQSKLDE